LRKFDNIVKKPWGYEYVAYENEHCALWFLHIKDQHSTSMHCHPNKTTGLILLEGNAEVSFMSNTFSLEPSHKIMIRKGLFHSTKATSKSGINLFEIETPVDKFDLVRLRDSYGREGKPYEDVSHEYPKLEDCLRIEEPLVGQENIYSSGQATLRVCNIKDVQFFNDIDDDKNIMFLKGGIITEYGINVAGPGDIVSGKVIKELIKVFDKTKIETIIMVFE
jgi:mannose-6-phosphate isomerase-like protein (cupin superfamily)